MKQVTTYEISPLNHLNIMYIVKYLNAISNFLKLSFKRTFCLAWWHSPLIPASEMQGKVDTCGFQASQGYLARPCLKKESNNIFRNAESSLYGTCHLSMIDLSLSLKFTWKNQVYVYKEKAPTFRWGGVHMCIRWSFTKLPPNWSSNPSLILPPWAHLHLEKQVHSPLFLTHFSHMVLGT